MAKTGVVKTTKLYVLPHEAIQLAPSRALSFYILVELTGINKCPKLDTLVGLFHKFQGGLRR